MCFCVHAISIVYIIVCVRVCFFPFSVFLETHMRGMKQICFMIKSVTIRRIIYIYINRSSRYAFPGLLCTDHSPCRKINNSWADWIFCFNDFWLVSLYQCQTRTGLWGECSKVVLQCGYHQESLISDGRYTPGHMKQIRAKVGFVGSFFVVWGIFLITNHHWASW